MSTLVYPQPIPKIFKGSNLIRIPKVMEKTGVAKSTLWLWVKDGNFPKPIKLSPRIAVWIEDEVNEWMMGNWSAA